VTAASDTLELREIRAQAAVWVTDLHGPERDAELEAGLRRWLAEDPRHEDAFELASEAWQCSGNLGSPLPDHRRKLSPRRLSLMGAGALGLVLLTAFYWLKDPTLTTGPAEQKTVDLADGTQVTLNANSRVVVEYGERIRKVILTRGEVLFNVAKNPSRPFVAVIGTRKVIALGTSFEIRREDAGSESYSVTLLEGHIAVEPLRGPDQIVTQGTLPIDVQHLVTLLDPGQRLHFASNKPDQLDRPALEKVTAWQRGQLIFEDSSLRAAAAEFNRYGHRRLSIDPRVPEKLRVGGVFRIGDPESFAQAMANAYPLRVEERGQEIYLTVR
jgi:transmembrane sensor